MCPNGSMAGAVAQALALPSSLDQSTYSHAVGSKSVGWAAGTAAIVDLYPGGLRLHMPAVERVGGGRRGEVFGKSRQARRRQMATMMQLRPAGALFFVTLTLSDEVLRRGWSSQVVAGWVKDKLRALQMRFSRAFHGGWALWSEEWQTRKSGDFRGVLVPHFHLIVGGVQVESLAKDTFTLASSDGGKSSGALRLQSWFKQAWADVCGLDDEHRRRGADVRELDSRRRIFAYVSKYTGKALDQPVDPRTGELIHTGRMWGYWNKSAMPLFEPLRLGVTRSELVALRRLVKRWLRARGGKSSRRFARWLSRSWSGFVVFGFGLDALGGVVGGLHGGQRSDGEGLALLLRVLDLESG